MQVRNLNLEKYEKMCIHQNLFYALAYITSPETHVNLIFFLDAILNFFKGILQKSSTFYGS